MDVNDKSREQSVDGYIQIGQRLGICKLKKCAKCCRNASLVSQQNIHYTMPSHDAGLWIFLGDVTTLNTITGVK